MFTFIRRYATELLVSIVAMVISQPGMTAWIDAGERPYEVTEEREGCSNYRSLKQPLFGDLHIHTAYSFDANAQDTRNTPTDSYNFAKGFPMGIQPYREDGSPSRTIKLDRPLDFAAVTDHAEFLGEMNICNTKGESGYWHPVCIVQRHFPEYVGMTMGVRGLLLKSRWGLCGDNNEYCREKATSVWGMTRNAAEEAYDKTSSCEFTSLVGYEFTATIGAANNLHRNVIFRNNKVPPYAQSWIESPSAESLWSYLESECVSALWR